MPKSIQGFEIVDYLNNTSEDLLNNQPYFTEAQPPFAYIPKERDTPTRTIPPCDWLLLFMNVLFNWPTPARRTPIHNCVKRVLIVQELLK